MKALRNEDRILAPVSQKPKRLSGTFFARKAPGLFLCRRMVIIIWIIFMCIPSTTFARSYYDYKKLACHCCGKIKVSHKLITALNKLSNKVGYIEILSGYRCPLHNRQCGGAKNSQHLYGNAVDIKIKGYTPSQVAQLAKQCGFTWVKVYSSWTHIDVRIK